MSQLSPYLMLEYMYGDSSTQHSASNAQYKPARLYSEYTGEMLFLNGSGSKDSTGNVLDYSAANLSGANWVVLDRDVAVPYITQDSKLTYKDMSTDLASLNIMYDTVRIHIQSGYNFDNIEGLLIQVYVREAVSKKMTNLTANVLLKNTDRILFNASPFYMTDRVYDKYIDILVPSVQAANVDYYSDPTNKASLGGQYASDGNGFLLNTNIYVKVSEIDTVSIKNTITYFKTNQEYSVSVRQTDIYSSIYAVVKEASDGDYFEYYPSNAGAFIEDTILELNSEGGNYVVINQIDVTEQVGFNFVNTFSFMNMQTKDFDQAATFRPILKYADVSPSFSIDYTVRIYNTENAFQIIKTASVSSYYPKKYGKNLERIGLSNVTSPLKVYNKVFTNQTLEYTASAGTSQYTNVYIPVFFDSKNLFVGAKNILAEGASPLNPSFNSDDLYFGQGQARLYLGEFDQYFKFSVYQLMTKTNSLNSVDLSKLTLYIGFTDSSNKLFTIPAQASTVENSLNDGEVVFKIDKTVKNRMGLTAKNTKQFYILSDNNNGEKIKIYSGTVQDDSNESNEAARVSNIGSQAVTLKELSIRTYTGITGATGATSVSTSLGTSSTKTSVMSQLNAANVLSVKADSNTQMLGPVIPGFTTDDNAQNMSSITPVTT